MSPTRARVLSCLSCLTVGGLGLGLLPADAGQPRGDINSPIDLVMIQCMMPSKVRLGQKFQLRDEVENGGQDAAPESITIYYLSTDDVLDEKDQAIKGRRVPPLVSGQRQSQPTTIAIEFDVPPGDYYLIAVADARGHVPERIEGNNTKATLFTLLPRK